MSMTPTDRYKYFLKKFWYLPSFAILLTSQNLCMFYKWRYAMTTTRNKLDRSVQQLDAALIICLSVETLCKCPNCHVITSGLKDQNKASRHGNFLFGQKHDLVNCFNNHSEIVMAIRQVCWDSHEHCRCDTRVE
jgi:hypothetical protein